MWWIFGTLYLIGCIAFYIADGYFDFDLKERQLYATYNWTFGATILWPIGTLIVIARKLKQKAIDARAHRINLLEKKKRLRVAEEQQLEKIMAELDQEEQSSMNRVAP
jgi:hypothetical protein